MKSDEIKIRIVNYVDHGEWHNVFRGRKLLGRFPTREKAEEFIVNRWYKVSAGNNVRMAKTLNIRDRDDYVRAMNAAVAEVEAQERPN